jgi:hypothetical protein
MRSRIWRALLTLVAAASLATAAAAQSTPPCKLGDVRPKAGSASIAQPAGASFQSKQWQPAGGLIEIAVSDYKADADAIVTACFRWKLKDNTKTAEFVESPPKSIALTNGVLKVTVEVPQLADTNEEVARRVWVVPLAEVRVIAVKSGNTVQVDTWTEIGITYPFISLMFALAVIVLVFAVLNIVVKDRVKYDPKANWFLRIISTPSGVASLSQFQMLLWTFVVAGSAIYVATLSGQLVEVTTGTLVLLGISGAATLAAQAQDENQAATTRAAGENARPEAERLKTEAEAAEATAKTAEAAAATARAAANAASSDTALESAAQDAEKKATGARKQADDARQKAKAAAENAGERETTDSVRRPLWSDLIVNESDEKGREIDVARVQMLLFTLVSAVFVTVKVIAAYVIPEIPVGYLTLMGISNGVYVGSKVVRKT